MDRSTDYPYGPLYGPPAKYNKKSKMRISLTACLIDHSCQRNFVRFYASLRWVNATNLGSVSGASDVIADHYIFAIFVAAALHERPGSPRNPIAILFILIRIVKPGTSLRTRRRIGRTKWRRKLHSKQHKSRGLPEIFRSFIYIYL